MNGEFLYNGPVDGPLLLLAHGAGAGADSDFMQAMATLLGQQGIRVVRFDFLYMQKARLEQKKRPPAPVAALLSEYRQVLEQLLAEHPCSVIIGGKSMGGRIASMLLQQDDCPSRVQGAVCLGYPFHPPGKPESLRTAHLMHVQKPLLLVQGERDALGNLAEVKTYGLDQSIECLWLDDGDHDLKPRQRSGFTHEQHLTTASERVAGFIRRLTA